MRHGQTNVYHFPVDCDLNRLYKSRIGFRAHSGSNARCDHDSHSRTFSYPNPINYQHSNSDQYADTNENTNSYTQPNTFAYFIPLGH